MNGTQHFSACFARFLAAVLLTTGVCQAGFAGVIDTETHLQASAADARIERAQAFLSRGDVQAQLQAQGVPADEAFARVAALSDAELNQLDQAIADAPAGAAILEIAGAVLVVLIILELTGTIDIFKKV